MERSPELEAWARELFASGDPARIAAAHSQAPDVLVIGSDANEWIEGGEAVQRIWAEQAGLEVEVEDVRCYEEGSVSWMAGRVKFTLPDGSTVPARVTGVAHRESGNWKVVQSHTSVGQ
jgi:hypothetical protein